MVYLQILILKRIPRDRVNQFLYIPFLGMMPEVLLAAEEIGYTSPNPPLLVIQQHQLQEGEAIRGSNRTYTLRILHCGVRDVRALGLEQPSVFVGSCFRISLDCLR